MNGSSLLTDPLNFYRPVYEWVENYINSPAEKTTISLKFYYIDSASVQAIFDILKLLKKMPAAEKRIVIKWYFEFDDPELLEIGEIMETRLNLKFEFIQITNNQQ